MSEAPDKNIVLVGLGNPGKKYELTRHNIGALLIKTFAQTYGWNLKQEGRFEAEVASGQIGEWKVHILLPTTYMNESGRAVRRYMDFYRLTPQNIVAVADDVELPFTMIRLRPSGSAGGHNGLKSVEKYIGTQEYLRLRMGVGEKRQTEELADHVLGRFSSQEIADLPEFIDRGAHTLLRLLKEDVHTIMNDVNKKVKNNKEDPLQEGLEKKT